LRADVERPDAHNDAASESLCLSPELRRLLRQLHRLVILAEQAQVRR